jgi:hypothetical protein
MPILVPVAIPESLGFNGYCIAYTTLIMADVGFANVVSTARPINVAGIGGGVMAAESFE